MIKKIAAYAAIFLLADIATNDRNYRRTRRFASLETEFHGLPGLDICVPTDVLCRVRIAAAQRGVP